MSANVVNGVTIDMALATDKTKISSYVNAETVAKAKVLAAMRNKSLSGLVELLLEESIQKAEKRGIQLGFDGDKS